MNALRLSILFILTYIPLYSQEGSVLVQTMPAKLSFPNYVIPRFYTNDFKNLVEKKLYQMAYDAINDRIAKDPYFIHIAIVSSQANVEFVKAIFQHWKMHYHHNEPQHIRGLLTAAERGYWEMYNFLEKYGYEYEIASENSVFYKRCDSINGIEQAPTPCLISAVAGGFFDFVFNEFRWREEERVSQRKFWRAWFNESWEEKCYEPYWQFRYARVLCNANTAAEPIPSAYWDTTRNKWFLPTRIGGKAKYSLALHAAVDCNRKDIVIFLLQNGADPCKEDHEKDTALSIAQRRNYTDIEKILRLFIRYRDFITQINTGKKNHECTCKLLTACPALASHCLKDIEGNTSLHYAVKVDDTELITTLLERDPLLVLEANKYGFSPLECSFLNGNHEALKAILAYAYRVLAMSEAG